MSASSAKSNSSLGFLSIVETEELGLIGGYLLLNAAGRPLEFHCTAPVKPSRTQAILYGAALAPFLYGEQIGQTLLAKSKLSPLVVCTDCEAALATRDFTSLPLVFIQNTTQQAAIVSHPACGFPLGRHTARTAPHHDADEAAIRAAWPTQAEHLDLLEPFARIREALTEAQKSARPAA